MNRDFLFRLEFHRKEQWDLNQAGTVIPLICVHFAKPDSSARILCLWQGGIQVGSLVLSNYVIRFGKFFLRGKV